MKIKKSDLENIRDILNGIDSDIYDQWDGPRPEYLHTVIQGILEAYENGKKTIKITEE